LVIEIADEGQVDEDERRIVDSSKYCSLHDKDTSYKKK
jgi:hypothetical protein